MAWQQGQHLALVGSTGSGKTTLAREILNLRRYSISLLTKADTLTWPGWTPVRTARKIEYKGREGARYVFRPHDDPETGHTKMRAEVEQVFSQIWKEGGWCLYIDEVFFVEHVLRLSSYVQTLLTQGRSKHITVVLGVQRPAWVSRFALSEPTYIVSSRLHDGRDIKTMRDIGGEGFADDLQELDRYQFLALNRNDMTAQVVTRETVAKALSNR